MRGGNQAGNWLIRWMGRLSRQLGGGEGGTKERLWPQQATVVECLRHAILSAFKAQVRTDQVARRCLRD
jgi:hypothetical protein